MVVELKVGKFKPEYAGQLGFYVELLEDRLRRPAHGAAVGLLLCTDKNDRVVRYALASSNQPIAIASYDLLPAAERAVLPLGADLSREFESPRTNRATARCAIVPAKRCSELSHRQLTISRE